MIKEIITQQDKPTETSRSLGLRMKESSLAILNQRFKIDGFENLSDMVKGYMNGEITKSNKTDQLSRLLLRIKEKNIVDPLTGEATPTFYKNVDIDDFRHYLKGKYKYSRYGDDLVKYYQRFSEFFFTKPEIVKAESGRNRSWICDAMRRFGEYYDYKHQNPEMKMLVKEIIERYKINRHMRMHDKVWIADQSYLDTSITKILTIFNKGELSILIRFFLFTGLRGEEISYVHQKPICPKLAGCTCENLHVVNKSNGMSVVVINRIMGQKHCYFTIVPSKLWQDFRALSKVDYEFRKFAHLQIKEATNGDVTLIDLRKYHYNINVRSQLKELGAEVLAGRAKNVSAKHYLLNELDAMSEHYRNAWKKYGII
jgi:hypothetical protein